MTHQSQVWSVAFSRDGTNFLTRAIRSTILWNVATNKPVARHNVGCWAFRPDMKVLLVERTENLSRLLDAATGQPIGPPLEQVALAFSSDGKTLASAINPKYLGYGMKPREPPPDCGIFHRLWTTISPVSRSGSKP